MGLAHALATWSVCWRQRIAMWRHHAADTLSVWLFGEPMPRPQSVVWRLRSWNDGKHWTVYLFRGDEWFGVGVGLDLHTAAHEALAETRVNMRRRRRQKSKPARNTGDSREILRHK